VPIGKCRQEPEFALAVPGNRQWIGHGWNPIGLGRDQSYPGRSDFQRPAGPQFGR